ncbi:MAG: aldo/keto reductase [Alphaproteobacteria bacterium]|nr:aldo/keto reductase [Alphaproteobacteria bacterium]
MQRRALGRTGAKVSALGLGCAGMSPENLARDDAEAIATVGRALDLGVDFIDTSDAYGNGHNEELIAKAIKGRRKELFLATKFGNIRGPQGQRGGTNGKPDYVPVACDNSLRRLGVDVIDLYYLHRVDPEVPIEDTVGAMAKLVQQGKVRFLGLSEAKPDVIRRAHAVHPIAALESEYSLWTRDAEREIMPLCRALGISYVPYCPLGRGFLSGTIRAVADVPDGDRRHDHPRFHDENLRRNLALLKPLDELAKEKGCTQAQIALAWVLSRGPDVIPIPGSRRRPHLEENAKAADVTLTEADCAKLEKVFAIGATAGLRYPEKQMPQMSF